MSKMGCDMKIFIASSLSNVHMTTKSEKICLFRALKAKNLAFSSTTQAKNWVFLTRCGQKNYLIFTKHLQRRQKITFLEDRMILEYIETHYI